MASIYKADVSEIKKAMIDKEIDTIIQLASITGVNRNSLSKILNGETQPSSEIMDRLVDALEIEPETAGKIFFGQHLRNT